MTRDDVVFTSTAPKAMQIAWTDDRELVDWEALASLYRQAPLGNRNAEQVRVFANSQVTVFGMEGGMPVAAGRALSDGADCACICDVAVLPGRKRSGVGTALMQRLLDALREHRKIILHTTPGMERFYWSLGFMPLLTAMARFQDRHAGIARGHLGAFDERWN